MPLYASLLKESLDDRQTIPCLVVVKNNILSKFHSLPSTKQNQNTKQNQKQKPEMEIHPFSYHILAILDGSSKLRGLS